jgi:hypothetical protein
VSDGIPNRISRVDDERKRRAGMVCLHNLVKNSVTLYYVEKDKEIGLGGESDENPLLLKRVFFGQPKMFLGLYGVAKSKKGYAPVIYWLTGGYQKRHFSP